MKECSKRNSGVAFMEEAGRGGVLVRGHLDYVVKRRGAVVETFSDHNLVLNGMKENLKKFIADGSGETVAKVAFGTSDAAAVVTDTSITDPFEKAIDGFEYPDGEVGAVQFNWELTTAECNGKEISEFGLLGSRGTLLCRRVREDSSGNKLKPIPKEDDISLEGHWTIYF